MRRILILAVVLLAAMALAACSRSITYGFGSGRIAFDRDGLVLRAAGEPAAHVSPAGELRIGNRPVAVTAGQRELLRHYYVQARNAVDAGVAIGAQGAAFGVHALGTAIRSVFEGDSSAAKQQLDAQSHRIEAAARRLCDAVNALDATQRRLAAEIPALQPYASAGFEAQCTLRRPQPPSASDNLMAEGGAGARRAGGALGIHRTATAYPASPAWSPSP